MNNGALEDLFLHELQETYAAERLILATLATPAETQRSADAFLDRCVIGTRDRIKRLEQIFALIDCAPDESKRSATAGMIAEIGSLATIPDPEVQDAVRAAVQAVQQYFLAQYAMLMAWARLLQGSESVTAVLKEVHVSLLQPETGPVVRREPEPSKGASMGERLTALFDRKR